MLAVGEGGDAVALFEGAAETINRRVAALVGDFANAGGGHAEEAPGAFEALFAKVAAEADAARGAEAGAKVAGAHADIVGEFADGGSGGAAGLRGVVNERFPVHPGGGGGALGGGGETTEDEGEPELGRTVAEGIAVGLQDALQLERKVFLHGKDGVAQRFKHHPGGVFESDKKPVKATVVVLVVVILIRENHEATAGSEDVFVVTGTDDGPAAQGGDEHMAVVHGPTLARAVEVGAEAALEADDVLRQWRRRAADAVERVVGAGQTPAGAGEALKGGGMHFGSFVK